MNATLPAIESLDLVHRYGQHTALAGMTLRVEPGEIFALLGPNGSGKTTFFRLLSTLVPVTSGQLSVFGHSLTSQPATVRGLIGVVFQNLSCDRKLTVRENLRCQAALFGLRGPQREARIAQVAAELGLADRLDWFLEKLSGGLQRRVDIAKSLIHAPRLLVLDEPSTGLDPAARLDLWHALIRLRDQHGMAIVMTTHLLEEAEKAERIGILHSGRMVAVGQPAQLRSELGQRVLVIKSTATPAVINWFAARGIEAVEQLDQVRVSSNRAVEFIAPLTTELGPAIDTISLSQPSLEDVFIARTGHRFWDSPEQAPADPVAGRKSLAWPAATGRSSAGGRR